MLLTRVLLLLLFSATSAAESLCTTNGVSFRDIARAGSKKPIKEVLIEIKATPCFKEETNTLLISDPVTDLSTNTPVYKYWKLSDYDEYQQGFSVGLKTERHYFSLPPQETSIESYSCLDALTTSGFKIIPINNMHVIKSWACNNNDCAFSYFYSDDQSTTLDDLCNTL